MMRTRESNQVILLLFYDLPHDLPVRDCDLSCPALASERNSPFLGETDHCSPVNILCERLHAEEDLM